MDRTRDPEFWLLEGRAESVSGRRRRRRFAQETRRPGTISRSGASRESRKVAISKDSFEAQVLGILGPLHGVARRLTKNDADAEDLVAESITRAWRARDSLVDGG